MIASYQRSRQDYLKRLDPSAGYALPHDQMRESDQNAFWFLQAVLPQENDPAIRSVMQKEFDRLVELRVRLLILQGKMDDARQLLRANLLDSRRAADYAALAALRHGGTLDPEAEIRDLPDNISPPIKAALSLFLYRAKGDLVHAADFAPQLQSDDSHLALAAMIETDRFDAIARYLQSSASFSSSHPGVEVWANMMLDRRDDVRRLVAEADKQALGKAHLNLGVPGEDAPSFDALADYVFAGRMEEAIIESKKRQDSGHSAFHLLCQQLRIREALAAIPDRKSIPTDIPIHLANIGLGSEAREILLHANRPDIALDGSRAYESAVIYGVTLDNIGAHAEAAQWRKELFQVMDPGIDALAALQKQLTEAVNLGRQRAGANVRNAQELLDLDHSESLLQLTNDTLELQLARLDAVSFIYFENNPDLVDPSTYGEADDWWHMFAAEAITPAARYAKVVRLVNATLPESELWEILDKYAGTTRLLAPYMKMHRLTDWVNVLHRMHHDDIAVRLVQKQVEDDVDPRYFTILGDFALDKQDFSAAADYYRQAALTSPADPSLMYRLGLALSHSANPAEAGAGRQLIDFLPFLVLGSGWGADAVASDMRRFEGDARADAWCDDYVARYTCAGSRIDESTARAREMAIGRGEYQKAITYQKRALFFAAMGSPHDPLELMRAMALYHRLRALDSWSRKDFATVVDALNRELDNGPPDLDAFERTLPDLRAFNATAAERIHARALERLQAVVQDYPDAVQYRAQLTRLEKLR
jgi:hypothetical protein